MLNGCLNWVGMDFNQYTGYGYQNIQLVRTLRQDVQVKPVSRVALQSWLDMPGWMQRLNPPLDFRTLTIGVMVANAFRRLPGRFWGYTMYEVDKLPDEWVESVNHCCERLLVPCTHNALLFKQAGVRVPIHEIPLGIDPVEFPILPPPAKRDRPYTFMCLGDRGLRKGVEVAISAFCQAFPDVSEPVQLVIKSRKNGLPILDNASFVGVNISIIHDDSTSMADIYSQADCFIFPSYGEGWGIPPREAAAMGIPTIVPRHTGLEVGIDHWATRIIERYALQDASVDINYPKGSQWYVPDTDELVAHMRWVYENQDEACQQAGQNAVWLHAHQTWCHAGQELISLVEEYA